VSKLDKAVINCAGVVGGGALVVSMLGAETPAACLPKGALLDPVTGCILIAPEAIQKDDVVSLTSLAEYSAVFQIVFSFFNIGWALGSENAWDPIITGWKKKGGGGRGTCGEKVLLEAGANRTRGKALFYYE